MRSRLKPAGPSAAEAGEKEQEACCKELGLPTLHILAYHQRPHSAALGPLLCQPRLSPAHRHSPPQARRKELEEEARRDAVERSRREARQARAERRSQAEAAAAAAAARGSRSARGHAYTSQPRSRAEQSEGASFSGEGMFDDLGRALTGAGEAISSWGQGLARDFETMWDPDIGARPPPGRWATR